VEKEIERDKKYFGEVRKLIGKTGQIMDWREIIHVVMLPTAGEPAEIIEPSIQAVADSNFPNQQFIILLATEKESQRGEGLKKLIISRKNLPVFSAIS